jgi:hypothetical protein
MSKGRRPLLSLLTGTAISLLAAPRLSHALPIDEALTIQPIIVCDPSGACATPDLTTMQTVLDLVWAQAGIAPVLLEPETMVPVNDGGSGATQVGLTTGADNTIPVDGFRSLTRTKGNGQSLNPNTINLYLNNTLSPFVNASPQSGTVVRGTSFINGNGITISSNAVLDTVAHELGHVLGLDHANPDNNPIDPNNLMTAPPQGTRNIPTNISQIGVPGGTDQLSQVQINRARQPLFTVGLGRVTSTPFSGDSCSEIDTCFEVAFAANPSVTEALNSVVFKYAPGALVNGFDLINDPASAFETYLFGTDPKTGEISLTVDFLAGAFGQGDILDFGTSFDGVDGPPDPISVIFNFAAGFVSQAGFDSVTGADSGFGSFTFPCFFEPGPTFGEIIDFDPVPEPSPLVMLGTGVLGLGFARRRRSSAIPYRRVAIPT